MREVNSPIQSYSEQAAELEPEPGLSDCSWSLARGRVFFLTRQSLICELPPLRHAFSFLVAFLESEERPNLYVFEQSTHLKLPGTLVFQASV